MSQTPKGWKLVPIEATKEMEAAANSRVRPYHGMLESEWRSRIPGDLFRLAWPAMLDAAPESPTDHVVVTSAPEILSRIAEVAAAVGFQSGEPAMELAGQIVSVLAGHPEHIDRLMDQGTELFLDGTFGIENGTLTYRAINGQILSPSLIREKKGTQQ